jgi:hypothetical protein
MALGAAVVSIIQAANLLQVEAVERAAVDFLVERLDAGNVLSAMALGAHLSAGAIGRELRDKSKAWAMLHSEEVLAEPSFLELPAEGVAVLVESDDLSAPEDSVFGAVMAWVKKDEAGRKPELARLLPLIRFPPLKASPAEPLFKVRSVVSIIQAANLLQVEAVECAAVDFLVERLDAGNVLSAMDHRGNYPGSESAASGVGGAGGGGLPGGAAGCRERAGRDGAGRAPVGQCARA